MGLIVNKTNLDKNIDTLNQYLISNEFELVEFAKQLIKRGTCFVAYSDKNQIKFAPSRFLGYENNTIYTHKKNVEKDGRLTNVEISRILAKKVTPNPILEEAYKKYCKFLGFEPNKAGARGVERKYWEL
jgi:hypothetical protein